MISQNSKLQSVWHEFARDNGYEPKSAREAVDWAVEVGKLELPDIDPLDILAGQMSRALREEYATDSKGRRYRVNHAVRVTKEGVQHTFWGIQGFAKHEHMVRAYTQRREQVIGDLVQLQVDIEVYNDMFPDRPNVQLELDFTDDVAERRVA